MSDMVLVVVPGIGTLRLSREAYEAALVPLPAEKPAHIAPAAAQPELLDGPELARRSTLPLSYVMEQARQGKIPSVKVGKYRRFHVDVIAQLATKGDQLSAYQQAGAESQQNTALPKRRYRTATRLSGRATPRESGQ